MPPTIPALAALFEARADAICLVAKSWDYHVDVALGVTNEENLESISDSVKAIAERGLEPMIDCEHFFDGYKANRDYALACAKTAIDAGARWVILCDTNGGTLPDEVAKIVGEVTRHIPGDHLGIHAHNDTENAVANTLAAVRAGVRQIQGTLNGIGERCGNANLVSLIPTFLMKPALPTASKPAYHGRRACDRLTHVSRSFDELLNRAPDRQAPYVGESAFATKAGIHASAIVKEPETYEHVKPENVGNQRRLSGVRSGRQVQSRSLNSPASGSISTSRDPRLDTLLREVKEKEAEGYSYEGADVSFELLARRILDTVPDYFKVESFRVMVERRYNALGALITVSEATVKVSVDGETMTVGWRGQRPGQRARSCPAQGYRQISALHRGPGTGGLQGPYPERRDGGNNQSSD